MRVRVRVRACYFFTLFPLFISIICTVCVADYVFFADAAAAASTGAVDDDALKRAYTFVSENGGSNFSFSSLIHCKVFRQILRSTPLILKSRKNEPQTLKKTILKNPKKELKKNFKKTKRKIEKKIFFRKKLEKKF